MRFIMFLSLILISFFSFIMPMDKSVHEVVIKNFDYKRNLKVTLWRTVGSQLERRFFVIQKNGSLTLIIPNTLNDLKVHFKSGKLSLHDSITPSVDQEFHLTP